MKKSESRFSLSRLLKRTKSPIAGEQRPPTAPAPNMETSHASAQGESVTVIDDAKTRGGIKAEDKSAFRATRSKNNSSTVSAVSRDKLAQQIEDVDSALGRLRPPNNGVETTLEDGMTALETFSSTWDTLLENIAVFTSLVEKLGEIHPYAKMASTILLAATKPFTAQFDRDNALRKLFEKMLEVYENLIRAEFLKDLDDHRRKVLHRMSLQTVECAYFIRDQSKVQNFWLRAARHAISGSGIDATITAFIASYNDLMRAFTERTALEGEIVALRIMEELQDIGAKIDLQDLLRARNAGMMPRKACMPNTRLDTLNYLTEWINDTSKERVLFLVGGAGTGKSSIAHAISQRFQALRRLGSLFCFDRNFQGDRHPESVFSTIARDLADWNPSFKRTLASVIKEQGALAYTADIGSQWDYFILEPAKRLKDTVVGPVLIVIDAFDECGFGDSRRLLLSILTRNVEELPSNFRVIVTSRPDTDVVVAIPALQTRNLNDAKEEATRDIALYIRNRFSVAEPRLGRLNDSDYQLLAEKAEGLFQWAFTACETMLEQRKGGLLLKERLRRLLQAIESTGLQPLDGLYSSILAHAFDASDPEVMSRFRSVLAQVLCALEPLSIDTLDEIRRSSNNSDEDIDEISLIVPDMGSLLIGVMNRETPIRPYHTSFRDFLTTAERSHVWYIDAKAGHDMMAVGSFLLMNKFLRFNICGFPSSFLRNSVVSFETLGKNISPCLTYASKSWPSHLTDTPDKRISALILSFLREKLLFWFEVLSALGAIHTAAPALLALHRHLHHLDLTADSHKSESALKPFVQDAIKFAQYFAPAMAQSIPHIYLSALPFAPKSSTIRQVFSKKFLNTISIPLGLSTYWPAEQSLLRGHEDWVECVQISPDRKLVVSSSQDKTIRIWNAETAQPIKVIKNGHTGAIPCVTFSPDSRLIASASHDKTVCVWNALTGQKVAGPLTGHEDAVYCIAFSPDSLYVVSGSSDKTIRIWDAQTGTLVTEPFRAHNGWVKFVAISPGPDLTVVSGSDDGAVLLSRLKEGQTILASLNIQQDVVRAAKFSPDGDILILSTCDRAIRIWDTKAGNVVLELLDAHSENIESASFSPDYQTFASVSLDKTLRVWDSCTGKLIAGPMRGHEYGVISVAYSFGRIVTGSRDGTVRIWNAETGDTVDTSETTKFHEEVIGSVSFAPDGSRIVSASNDMTVRLWDARTGDNILQPFCGHTGPVTSARFSPSGKLIVSGAFDETIRIWDASSGATVLGPLRGHTNLVNSVIFTNDSTRVISCSSDSTIRVWDVLTGHFIVRPLLNTFSYTIFDVAISPDDKVVVAASNDAKIYRYHLESLDFSESHMSHDEDIQAIVFSPDGSKIATGSADASVGIWDASALEKKAKRTKGHSGKVVSVAFSPDGQQIVSSSTDQTIRIWDPRTAEMLAGPFIGHEDHVISVAYSPSGERIVSGSHDTTIRIWDTVRNIWPSFEGEVTLQEDGWIKGPDDQLILWVPPLHRRCLHLPHTVKVIGSHETRLDFTQASFGSDWTACHTDTNA